MVQLIELFEKYAYWKILRYFALHTATNIYVKELSRTLNLSPGTCSVALREMEAYGILEKKELAQGHYYHLKENFLTNELKKFMGLFWIYDTELVDALISQDPDIISIALYGSYSNGDFDENSDLDIIVLSPHNIKLDLDDIEEKMDLVVSVESFTMGQWMNMKKRKDGFYITVLSNHTILYGGELP